MGASCSGKTWFAANLKKIIGEKAALLSLDDFYLDRSHLSTGQRRTINFDNPRAVDWERFDQVLDGLLQGRKTEVPKYDFATHARMKTGRYMEPKPFLILEGLWLLRRRSVRRRLARSVFIKCPSHVCLQRRINRDLKERGRDTKGVRRQYLQHVEPMQKRFVASQSRWADIVLNQPNINDVKAFAISLKSEFVTKKYVQHAD